MARGRIAVGLLGALLASSCATAQDDTRAARSREIVTLFQQELGARLTAALAAGGPVGAIAVCNVEAPEISARLSADNEARVSRTALKVRNPANTADAATRGVLETFRTELAADATNIPEHFEAADGTARYMRAIVMQPLCIVCHGDAVAPEVRAAVSRLYPADEATGFAVGDLRGAFVVEWFSERDGDAR